MNDLDAIRRRLDGVTPGPWFPINQNDEESEWFSRYEEDPMVVTADSNPGNFCAIAREISSGERDGNANAEFIAAARTHVPALADEVEQLRAELARADAQLIAANRRADGLHADLVSATKANTAYANENARLRQDRDTKADIAKNRAVIITDLGEVITRVEKFADEMTGYCSPNGVAGDYAQRLREVLRAPARTEAEATR